MVNVSNNGEIIVIEVGTQKEELTMKQAQKLRDDLYKAIGISYAEHGVKMAQQRLEDTKAGRYVQRRSREWQKFGEEIAIHNIETENLQRLKEGKKISIS